MESFKVAKPVDDLANSHELILNRMLLLLRENVNPRPKISQYSRMYEESAAEEKPLLFRERGQQVDLGIHHEILDRSDNVVR